MILLGSCIVALGLGLKLVTVDDGADSTLKGLQIVTLGRGLNMVAVIIEQI